MKLRPHLTLLGLLLLLAAPEAAQNRRSRGAIAASDREAPPLVAWQRSLDDAEALSRATGKPLLICVNMDGESASEVFAHKKYKSSEFTALMAGFVPLVISPNRHTPSDYDESGRRVPCTRFGVVICSEHIDIEPTVYRRYFKGRRVAPRHLAVASSGKILFDHFLLQNLYVVDDALEDRGVQPPAEPWRALLASRDAVDRATLEQTFVEGDTRLRVRLLVAAASSPVQPYDLIRLGMRDADPDVSRSARWTLARVAERGALDLLLEALAGELAELERNDLLTALARIADGDEDARRFLRVHRSLATPSKLVDREAWMAALAEGEPASASRSDAQTEDALIQRIENVTKRLIAKPDRPELQVELARTNLEYARLLISLGKNPSFLLSDAEHEAGRALILGADVADVMPLRVQATYLLGDAERAGEMAERTIPALVEHATRSEAADVLYVLARTRTAAIYRAESDKEDWAEEWLVDALAAFEILARHPDGGDDQVVAHSDLLGHLGLAAEREAVLRAGITRFPASAILHSRFRMHVQAARGFEALVAAYDELRPSTGRAAAHEWFTAYAWLVVAEQYQRLRRTRAAQAAYVHASELFESSVAIEVAYAETSNHFIALALAGRAHIALEAKRIDEAVESILASIERRPATAESEDGLQRTPLATLRRVRTAAREAGRGDLELRLVETLERIAPEVWSLAQVEPDPPSED